MRCNIASTAVLILAMSLLGACANTGSPDSTHDGLVRQQDSKFDKLYVRPGASLKGFSQYGVEPCEVAFRKNWLRDQNSTRVDLSNRVTQKNVDKIKDSLSEQCNKFMREALQEEPAYALVDSFDNGEAVLILRPKIINLDINAPDTDGPGIRYSYTTSYGEMTLSLDIVDGTTGEVLMRVVDHRRGTDRGYLQWTNGLTNRVESDRTLRRWAKQLRQGLDRAMAE